ncbi:MAG: class I SAM-dependent methyltransferase [Solirubrobacteraceae bacterium]
MAVPNAGKSGFNWRAGPLRLRNAARRLWMAGARKEVSEDVWRRRSGGDWVAGYWNDERSPRRDQIVGAIRSRFGAPGSVLDVGCNAAPNLRRIAGEFPNCRLSGFDINSEAISSARRFFAQLGIPVDLRVGSLYDVLPEMATDSADIITSSYVLAYVPPANLGSVLTDLLRIARCGIVLAEPHAFGGDRPAGVLTVPWYDWRHDYARLLVDLGVRPDRIAVSDAPSPGAPDSGLLVADLR